MDLTRTPSTTLVARLMPVRELVGGLQLRANNTQTTRTTVLAETREDVMTLRETTVAPRILGEGGPALRLTRRTENVMETRETPLRRRESG